MVPSLHPLTLQYHEPLQVSNTELYINFKWQPFTKYSKQNLEIKHIMRKTNPGEVIVLEREKKRSGEDQFRRLMYIQRKTIKLRSRIIHQTLTLP